MLYQNNNNNNNIAFLGVVDLYISYTLDQWSRDLNSDFTLGNCLFGSAKLAKNADLDKYKYSGYGIGFNSRSKFLLKGGIFRKNVVIFRTSIGHLWVLIIKIKIS